MTIQERAIADISEKLNSRETKTLAKWSLVEYHQMIAAGILQNRRVELLAGEIVEMSPESPLHYNTAKRGTRYLEELLGDRAEIRFNGSISLSNSEPEPDIAIVAPPESRYNDRHPGVADIFWLVEVAQTSLKKDTEIKPIIYASEGILEYWLLNLPERKLIVFRDPQQNSYTTRLELEEGMISPLAFPDITVSCDRLFLS
ncbi:MAG: Uma2 family endonuclease [Cyanobacteria bacterium P01_E01_bin.42]